MSDQACLALLLDAPLQSWGFASRFQRRTTALHPTRSGLLGMMCAALGLDKGGEEEKAFLARMEEVKITVIAIRRQPEGCSEPVEVRRLEDYHVTGGGYDDKSQTQSIPRKASGGPCDNPTLSYRQYLCDAKFGVVLAGPRRTLTEVAAGMRNPRWGVWLGRKSCIPAAPVLFGDLVSSADDAVAALEKATGRALTNAARIEEAESFAEGTDTLPDAPVNFAKREFKPRRIRQVPETVAR